MASGSSAVSVYSAPPPHDGHPQPGPPRLVCAFTVEDQAEALIYLVGLGRMMPPMFIPAADRQPR
jgi:hypothetical protein